jgi:outer membrane protein assembly factor BamC
MKLAAALSVLLLGACSMGSILPESKKIDYKSASKQTLPTLQIPPDLTSPGRDNRYSVPDVSVSPGQATFSSYQAERVGAPKGSTGGDVLPSVEKIRLERNGDQRWLVLPDAPDRIWPLVKEFWQENGFLVNVEQPAVGVMETDWAEDRAKIPLDGLRNMLGKVIDSVYDSGLRDKFRTRLERSSTGGTEIYISHRGMEEKYVSSDRSQTVWQSRPPDPNLEAEFLRRMMLRFGVDEGTAKSQVAAAGARPSERAKLTRTADGNGALELDEPFDRAWRRVGLALDRVGFTVEDRDRSKGYYFVRYVDPESDVKTKKDDSGFLSKLAFWRSSDPKKNSNEQFRVVVKDAATDTSEVQVLNKDGAKDASDTSRKILTLLQAQLK